MSSNPNELITVCAKCLKAECGNGIKMCNEIVKHGTIEMTRAELIELDLEHTIFIRNKPGF